MSVIYFTNNADNGDGSLRAAIASAQPGDVICPDETVFERGSTIEIALASQLNVDKNLTIDGRQFSITLNGSGNTTCVYVEKYVAARFIRVDFVNGVGRQELEGMTPGGLYVRDYSTVTAEQCRFVGCKGSSSGGFAVRSYAVLNIYDCLVAACYGYSSTVGAGASVARDGTLNAIGSTFIGNVGIRGDLSFYFASGNLVNAIVGKLYVSSQCSVEQTACVVDVKPSRLGFATPPPDTIAAADWTPELWKSWDLHLLDDGSDTPSPYRDAGDVEHMSRYDLDGNFRGRETNGVATCSPGAYETIQADLFIFGTGLSSTKIKLGESRFATDAQNEYVIEGTKSIFIEGELSVDIWPWKTFIDQYLAGEDEGVDITIGGNSIFRIKRDYVFARDLVLGVGAIVDCGDVLACSFKLGREAAVYSNCCVSHGDRNFADTGTYVQSLVADKNVPANPLYGSLAVTRNTDSSPQLSGDYYCDLFVALSMSLFASVGLREEEWITDNESAIVTATGTKINAKNINFVEYYPNGKVFTNPVDFKLFGEETVVQFSCNSEQILDSSYKNLILDITNANTVNIRNTAHNNFVLYGENDDCRVVLESGSYVVDNRNLKAMFVGLYDAQLTIQNSKVALKEFEVSGSQVWEQRVVFSGATSALTATEYMYTEDFCEFDGAGYLGIPADATLVGAQIGKDVRVCKIGAGVEAITSSSTQPYVADVAWSGADATVPVVVERKVADGWAVIDAQAVGSVALLDISDETTIRVWDGEKFIEHTPSEFPFDEYATCDYMFSQAVCGTVVAEKPDIFDVGLFYAGENLNVKAALVDSPSEQPVVKDFVDSLSLTVYKVEGTKRVPVTGWFEVDVPASVVSESIDADGFNVDYVSASSPFAEPGDYAAFFVAKFKKGNPATLVMNVAVN